MGFGENLKTLMDLFKTNNSNLARDIHVDASVISRWKNNDRKLSRNSPHLVSLAKHILTLKVDDFQTEFLDGIFLEFCSKSKDVNQMNESDKIYALIDWLYSDQTDDKMSDQVEIIKESPIAIGITRGDKILYANEALVKLFEFSDSSEIVGSSFFDRIPPQFRDDIRSRISFQSAGILSPATFEIEEIKKDGTVFPAYIEVEVINIADGPANATFIQDITNVRNLEKSIDKHLKNLNIILKITNIAADSAFSNHSSRIKESYLSREIICIRRESVAAFAAVSGHGAERVAGL